MCVEYIIGPWSFIEKRNETKRRSSLRKYEEEISKHGQGQKEEDGVSCKSNVAMWLRPSPSENYLVIFVNKV